MTCLNVTGKMVGAVSAVTALLPAFLRTVSAWMGGFLLQEGAAFTRLDDVFTQLDSMFSRLDDVFPQLDGMFSRSDDVFSRSDAASTQVRLLATQGDELLVCAESIGQTSNFSKF